MYLLYISNVFVVCKTFGAQVVVATSRLNLRDRFLFTSLTAPTPDIPNSTNLIYLAFSHLMMIQVISQIKRIYI